MSTTELPKNISSIIIEEIERYTKLNKIRPVGSRGIKGWKLMATNSRSIRKLRVAVYRKWEPKNVRELVGVLHHFRRRGMKVETEESPEFLVLTYADQEVSEPQPENRVQQAQDQMNRVRKKGWQENGISNYLSEKGYSEEVSEKVVENYQKRHLFNTLKTIGLSALAIAFFLILLLSF